VPLTPGTHLGRYELVGLIGAGGMGEVYRAHDELLRRDVAIKVLPQQLARDPERLARLEHEARATSALNHPAIVSVFDFGHEGDIAYIVTELLDGETLRQALPAAGLPVARVFDVAMQVASGLSAAHAKGIVHRDLKPENVFVTRDGRIKILDFGLALSVPRPGGADEGAVTAPLDGVVSGGGLSGTLGYVAPEQLRGEPGDHRVDIFAFGVVLYEITTGQRPFRGSCAIEILNAILKDTPEPVDRVQPNTPPTLARIIERCLSKQPDDRFQNASDLAFAIESASLPTAVRTNWHLPPGTRRSTRQRRRRAVLAGLALGLLALAVGLAFWRPWTSDDARPIHAIAVLPLTNLSGDASQDYFVDGVHEELIASLAKIHALRVISRTSVMRFKATRRSVREIARELRVDAVLEGSLRRSGDQVRTTFQLVAANSERQLWADTYQARVRDVLVLQSQVAQAVADEVRARLTPEERTRLARTATVNPEAHLLYLQGRFQWNLSTSSSLKASVALFERALAIDPSLTLAHAGLVESRGLIAEMDGSPPARYLPLLESSARHALATDPASAEAQASLGFAVLYGAENWDWNRAEAAFARAIQLSPGYSNAHAWYAQLLSLLGRHDEAVVQARRASELDPLNPFYAMLLASRLYYARRFPEALAQTDELRDIQPEYWLRHWIRGLTLQAMGKQPEAIKELRRAVELSEGSLECVPDLAAAEARAGNPAAARAVLTRLRGEAKRRFVPPYFFALVHTGLGEKPEALHWLEQAHAQRDWRVAWVGPEPTLDSLRGEPRFSALVVRLGLAQPRRASR
jgi:TolB-like protein